MARDAKVNWRGYIAAVAAVAAALLLTVLIPPIRGESPTALFFAAVMVSSWYGGLGPGLLATALAAWAIDYFIMPPVYALVLGLGDVVRIAVFVLVALLINSLNEARRQLERALRRRAEELAEADRRKDEFLAMLAHELRNPLAPIRNAIHILKERDDPAVCRAREILDRQAGHLTRLVDDLLDAARIARGQVVLRREVFDFAEAVKQAVEVAHPLIEARGHRLLLSLPWEPTWLDADRTRLVQVLSNLLTNAAKYTEPGGQIWLTAERLGDALVLRLKDTGIGIAPEMLSRVFDLFVQAGRPPCAISEGLGIGLALVKRLVELHGGTIHAQSRGPGCGSEFIVRLPVAWSRRHGATRPSPGRPHRTGGRGASWWSTTTCKRRRAWPSSSGFGATMPAWPMTVSKPWRWPSASPRGRPPGHRDAGDGRLRAGEAVARSLRARREPADRDDRARGRGSASARRRSLRPVPGQAPGSRRLEGTAGRRGAPGREGPGGRAVRGRGSVSGFRFVTTR